MEKLIDLTHTLTDLIPVYPGDKETRLYHTQNLTTDGYNNHRLETGMHAGTHIDSPMHLLNCNTYISEFPLENFIGKGCLIDARNQPIIKMKPEYESKIIEDCILLFYTGWDTKFGTHEYFNSSPVIDEEFAHTLVQKKIKILGIDTASPDRYPFNVHKALLKNNIPIIENLTNLEKLLHEPNFEVIAFPLKIKADSSILRAVARII